MTNGGLAAAGAAMARSLLWVTASASLGLAGPAAAQPAEGSSGLLERGGTLYSSLCQRCHGDSGDATDYPGIVPLAGIDRRLGEQEIAELSAPFVGRVFEGGEARALAAYLGTLGGEKGFAEPGFLFSPDLLDRKRNDVHGYRIVDIRARVEDDEGHVVNAVHWPDLELVGPSATARGGLAQVLAELGIQADTFVVVYDEAGGPSAASLWWSLVRAGHTRAAVLDGGWEAWREAGHRVSGARPRFAPAPLPEPAPGDANQAPATPDVVAGVRSRSGGQADAALERLRSASPRW